MNAIVHPTQAHAMADRGTTMMIAGHGGRRRSAMADARHQGVKATTRTTVGSALSHRAMAIGARHLQDDKRMIRTMIGGAPYLLTGAGLLRHPGPDLLCRAHFDIRATREGLPNVHSTQTSPGRPRKAVPRSRGHRTPQSTLARPRCQPLQDHCQILIRNESTLTACKRSQEVRKEVLSRRICLRALLCRRPLLCPG